MIKRASSARTTKHFLKYAVKDHPRNEKRGKKHN